VSRKQEKEPFHNPFAKLRGRATPVEKPGAVGSSSRPGAAGAGSAAPLAVPPAPARAREASEDELWADAVTGVARLDQGHGLAAGPAPPVAASEPFWHPDLEAIQALEALVSGEAPFDLSDTDEYIEGRVPGLDAGIVRRLRRGEFAVQGHIDLHGMTREEAKGTVDAFLKRSRSAGKRCVLLVHGRGIHSKDQVPILKDALRHWLATARFGRHVLAFATARPADGGAGALYVLLRRAGR